MARIICTPADLQQRLNAWFTPVAPANRPSFVLVCDIGQGNLNAVINTDGKPFLYFDMGGGIDASLFTYPHPTPVFCYDANPHFVLSHWDGDHFKTALAERAAGRLGGTEWMAPAQDLNTRAYRLGLSARAKAFRLDLVNNADLYVWPDGAAAPAAVTSSYFTVLKVNGRNLNNHGLALRIASPDLNGDFMLLTGDATFEGATFGNAVHGCDTHCVGLVSGHHSSEVGTAADIPDPPAATYTLAHSFGWGNAYGHPSTTGVDAYTVNWDDDHRLDTGGSEAGAHVAGPRGNVGLLWRAPLLGPGAVPLASNLATQKRAAIGLIAAASAELELYSPGLAHAGQIAVAAAHNAAVRVSAIPARAGSAQVAAAMLAGPPPTLAAFAAGAGGVAGVAGPLNAALLAAPASAAAAAVAAVPAMADAVAEAVMTAALTVAQRINAAAVAAAFGRTIGSQARSCSNAAYNHTADPGFPAAVEAVITNALANAIRNTTRAVENANVPTVAQVKTAIAAALIEVARVSIGHTNQGFGALLAGRTAPAAAEAAVAVVVLARDDLKAAICAAAALAPSIPINPEAGPPAALVANDHAERTAAIAATAAICGRRAGATAAQSALAAVAAARVTLPAALGAPQVNCHRHPRTCAGVCSMSIHYALV